MNPMVSVILPVYNSEKYIDKTIKSVLNQSYENFELLIINDFPTDNTMSIIDSIYDERIHIIYNGENKGIAYSRNKGIECSKGKYVALMDHDDIALRNRFEKQVAFLEENPDVDVVGGRIRLIDQNDKFISAVWDVNRNPQVLKALLLMINPYSNSEVTFRRDFVIRHNIKYDDNMLGLEDFKFWIQCSKFGKLSNVNDLVQYRRIMKSSETGRIVEEKLKERLRLYGELQKYSLMLSGISLSTENMEILQKVVSDGCGACESGWEFKKFYDCLGEIVGQASRLQVDFLEGLYEVTKSLLISKSANMSDALFWR